MTHETINILSTWEDIRETNEKHSISCFPEEGDTIPTIIQSNHGNIEG